MILMGTLVRLTDVLWVALPWGRPGRQRDMVGSTGKLASSSELDRSLTFGDVAGVDQAKSQVQVIIALLLYVLSTCPPHTKSGCGKERRILIGPW